MDSKNKDDVLSGILMCNAGGFGFVRPDSEGEGDIFIPHRGMGKAYDGDRVLVKIDSSPVGAGRREGHIIRVLGRGIKQLAGVVRLRKRGVYKIAPDRREFFSRVRVKASDLNGARLGDRVIVSVIGYDIKNKPQGRVSAVLGRAESISGFINGIIAENGLPINFSDKAVHEAAKVPLELTESDIYGREDLRDKIIFTIDGDDSRDFDDAVSLENAGNGNKILGVHIADVTHYVREGSALDINALKRGTSVYFPNMVLPMLPERLSNGICSLNPDCDRLTLSVFMECDKDGSILNHRIIKSVIRSAARMTYNNVNKILDGDTELRDKYSHLVAITEDMAELAEKMSQKRSERGAIDFDFPETKIICDSLGNPAKIQSEARGRSQKIIESFMLAANETVAETAYWADLPFIYRVHDAPDSEKLTAFNEFIKNFNLSLNGRAQQDKIHPKDIQRVLEAAQGKPEEMMIAKMALRSLMKACYRGSNSGHFGLAARYYCHFTSPIRRYPDLMVHRILKEFIDGKMSAEREAHYDPIVNEAAVISSDREIAAQNAERAADDLLKTAYMQRFIGEAFDAVVSSVTSFGMFAQLENSCEGLIRCEDMGEDYFEFSPERGTLTGQYTGKTYRIGDKVRIIVAKCDLTMRRVDFVPDAEEHSNSFEKGDYSHINE